jgi:2,5-furandicarboxylate decarboxylase 1
VAKDLSGFIAKLRREYPQEIVEIDRPVRPDQFEVTALLEHLTKAKRFPLVLFRNCADLKGRAAGVPIATNVFARRERCALALDFPPEKSRMELSLHYSRLERQRMDPVTVPAAEAPVKEVVLSGDQIDLAALPIVRHFEMDLGAVLTMTACMRDPETGVYDVSFIKAFYKGPRKLGISIHTPHLERILSKYETMGRPAPIVYILGHHPAFSLGTLALTPYERDDYESIGAFLQEPMRLTPSTTWGDRFMVPADAEIVIEGEIPPGVREIVDPFGETTRHYQAQCLRQVMNVTALTRRREAILQDVFSGHEESWNLGSIPKEGGIYNSIQAKYGNVVAVHLPYSGVGRLSCYISLKKNREGQVKRAALLALNESVQTQVVVQIGRASCRERV